MNGLLTLLFLTIFVVLHELGHFIAARRSKIAVTEFFVGFGPKLFSFKNKNTEYGLKAIPLGGYVKIPGMDESEETIGYEENQLFHQTKWTTKAIYFIIRNYCKFYNCMDYFIFCNKFQWYFTSYTRNIFDW